MKQLLRAVLLSASLTTCNKDDDDKKTECVLNEAAVIGVYSVTSVSYKLTSTSTPVDQLPDAEPCERDNSYHFKSNGVFQLVEDGIQALK
ncbi:hypothetical protein [Flavihumibacter petaseus]|nr:hypothetical protein [Flavihumibacter petaseus]